MNLIINKQYTNRKLTHGLQINDLSKKGGYSDMTTERVEHMAGGTGTCIGETSPWMRSS